MIINKAVQSGFNARPARRGAATRAPVYPEAWLVEARLVDVGHGRAVAHAKKLGGGGVDVSGYCDVCGMEEAAVEGVTQTFGVVRRGPSALAAAPRGWRSGPGGRRRVVTGDSAPTTRPGVRLS